jgi:GNAT superfamily N-acetyltransferase
LNLGEAYKQLSARYGPYREYILVAYDKADEVIGGANFICLTLPELPGHASPVISINLNYVFVLPAHRGKGYLRPILKACSHLALRTFPPLSIEPGLREQAIFFFEQNDPVRMSVEEYESDSTQSGLDQIQRIAIWARVGARIIDFPYVQPALSVGQKADHNLLLCVMGEGIGAYLDPCLLKSHLERFFQISVLKNKTDVHSDRDASLQITALTERCQHASKLRLADGGIWAAQSANLGKGVIGMAKSLREVMYVQR